MPCLAIASRGLRRGGSGGASLCGMFGAFGAAVRRNISGHGSRKAMFEAIVMTESNIVPPFGKMKDEAKTSLKKAVEGEKLHVKRVEQSIFVGNERGLNLVDLSLRLDSALKLMNEKEQEAEKKRVELEKKHQLLEEGHAKANKQREALEKRQNDLEHDTTEARNKQVALEERQGHLEQQNLESTEKQLQFNQKQEEHTKQIGSITEVIENQKTVQELADSDHEGRLQDIVRSDKDYKLMRARFICTFKRGIGKATKADRATIAAGNEKVHSGDVVTDASLYKPGGQRRDISYFKRLYGVEPCAIEKINHPPTIHVLNTHATILASDQKVTKRFRNLFGDFVKKLEKSNYDVTYLEGKPSEVTNAYRAFLGCFKTDVKQPKKHKGRRGTRG